MQGKAKLLGHSIHPMLVGFPVGLLGVVPIFAGVALATHAARWAEISFWMLTCGLCGGLLAAVFGLLDWLSIPTGTRAYRVGLVHLALNLMVMGCYGATWGLMVARGPAEPNVLAFVLSLLGLCLLGVSGWYGGELVEQHRMGVRDEAHLDAPSSLDRERLMRREHKPIVTPPSGDEPQPA